MMMGVREGRRLAYSGVLEEARKDDSSLQMNEKTSDRSKGSSSVGRKVEMRMEDLRDKLVGFLLSVSIFLSELSSKMIG